MPKGLDVHGLRLSLFGLLFGFAAAASAQSPSASDLILSARGLGPVRLGMTLKEATAARGAPLKAGDPTLGIKYKTYTTEDGFFWVGVADGRIHMACANTNRVSTAEGVRVDDSAKKLDQLPKNRLKKMPNNRYELQPVDPKDRGYIIWINVMAGKVSDMCAGTPAVKAYEATGGT